MLGAADFSASGRTSETLRIPRPEGLLICVDAGAARRSMMPEQNLGIQKENLIAALGIF